MIITEHKIIIPEEESNRLKAFAQVTFDDCLVVKNLKLIDVGGKIIVQFPNERDREGKYRDIIFPIKSGLRKHVNDVLISSYHTACKKNVKRLDVGIAQLQPHQLYML